MHNIMLKCNLIGYTYNAKHFQSDSDVPGHEKVVNKIYHYSSPKKMFIKSNSSMFIGEFGNAPVA